MKRLTCVIMAAVLCVLASAAAYAAEPLPVHLTISGCSTGQVFSVNQPFRVLPLWANGRPEVLGSTSLAYDWSPMPFVQSQAENTAVFSVPERQDTFELFVSARINGPGTWIVPTNLSDRIGSSSVVIAGLSDASLPHTNYMDERVQTRIAAPGQPFTLNAEWRNASGERTVNPPANVRYEWSCDEIAIGSVPAAPLSLHVKSQLAGNYTYVCRAYDTSAEPGALLCAVQFPVIVTDDVNRTFSISSSPAARHGVVFVDAGESAVLTAATEPSASGISYTWQALGSAGIWENVPGGSSAALEIRPGDIPAGSSREYRCLGTAGGWAGETPAVSVHVVDPNYIFETSPTDLASQAGSGLPLEMLAAVSHSDKTAAQAEWQYRKDSGSAWQPAALAVPGFTENVPRRISPGLTVFSWAPSGNNSAQNGEYRCVCGGTASASATLTITVDGALALSPVAPLRVSNCALLGSVLTGMDAPSARGALSAADLKAKVSYPLGYTPRILQHARIMGGAETVGTGCEIQLLDRNGEIAGGATLILQGDVLGSGTMGLSQLVRIAQALTEPQTKPLLGPFLAAGDFDGSGTIDLEDVVSMARLFIQDNAFSPLQTAQY